MCITDYVGRNFGDGHDDRELEIVYEIICTHAAGELPDHPRYYPRLPQEG